MPSLSSVSAKSWLTLVVCSDLNTDVRSHKSGSYPCRRSGRRPWSKHRSTILHNHADFLRPLHYFWCDGSFGVSVIPADVILRTSCEHLYSEDRCPHFLGHNRFSMGLTHACFWLRENVAATYCNPGSTRYTRSWILPCLYIPN